MKRFVECFHAPIQMSDPSFEDQINNYAETNHLTIVTMATWGHYIYVLFEKGGE